MPSVTLSGGSQVLITTLQVQRQFVTALQWVHLNTLPIIRIRREYLGIPKVLRKTAGRGRATTPTMRLLSIRAGVVAVNLSAATIACVPASHFKEVKYGNL